MITEFNIIEKYFLPRAGKRADVVLGIQDDAAIIDFPKKKHLVVSTDTIVEGAHFLPTTPAKAIGYKSLAVSLSDLASMGAEPAWVTLNLTLNKFDEQWMQQFSDGFFELFDQYALQLIGGDTTRGPLSVTTTVHGVVPINKALTRSGAHVGDAIYVTGKLGVNTIIPRVEEGIALRDKATACIDISDGLLADLGHILQLSNIGATIHVEKIPVQGDWREAVVAGEDFELCFTAPKNQTFEFTAYCIGECEAVSGLRLLADGKQVELSEKGYLHRW